MNEMRKKSPASIQKWVDSIETTNTENPEQPTPSTSSSQQDACPVKEESPKCDKINDIEISCSSDNSVKEPVLFHIQDEEASSTNDNNKKSLSYHENLKEIGKQKITEIYDRINIKSKKIELKNLLVKTSQKFKSTESQGDIVTEVSNKMQSEEEEESSNSKEDKENILTQHSNLEAVEEVAEETEIVEPIRIAKSLEIIPEMDDTNAVSDSKDSLNVCENLLNVSKSHIGLIGRSSSENPKPAFKKSRLQEIGRSFSVQDNDVPDKIVIDSTEDLIYDIDDESTSNPCNNNLYPSLNTSLKSINSNMSSASQNNLNSSINLKSVPLSPINKSIHDHALSEGHNSRRNSRGHMLRDCSFQVSQKKQFLYHSHNY